MRIKKISTIIVFLIISVVSSIGAVNVFAAEEFVYLGGMSAGFSVIT